MRAYFSTLVSGYILYCISGYHTCFTRISLCIWCVGEHACILCASVYVGLLVVYYFPLAIDATLFNNRGVVHSWWSCYICVLLICFHRLWGSTLSLVFFDDILYSSWCECSWHIIITEISCICRKIVCYNYRLISLKMFTKPDCCLPKSNIHWRTKETWRSPSGSVHIVKPWSDVYT